MPNNDAAVVARRCKPVGVRRKRRRKYRTGMLRDGPQIAPIRRVPQTHRMIVAGRDKLAAVGSKRDRVYLSRMPGNISDKPPRANFPNAQRLVCIAGYDQV